VKSEGGTPRGVPYAQEFTRQLNEAGDLSAEKVPEWWPYAAEFPYWHVWRGVAGLLYARRPKSSPPKVVRGKSTVDLRDQIRLAEVPR
jgi:hypothetical protein